MRGAKESGWGGIQGEGWRIRENRDERGDGGGG